MKHSKKAGFLHNFYNSYIPNKKDNFYQIIIKSFFLISVTTIIVAAISLTNYFLTANKQESMVKQDQNIWHSEITEVVGEDGTVEQVPAKSAVDIMLEENPDFKGWIKVDNTKIDYPIYQTDNNSFYLDHNQKQQKSRYGALFFDVNDVINKKRSDKNLIIYGHNMKDGSMFANLKEFKKLSFYKQNPTIEFSTLYKTSTYKIYSVFILNASKDDDNGRIYNITRSNFLNDADFKNWSDEAYQRSIINTNVDVIRGDNIITLVTCVNDFNDARLVVMARETRKGEDPAVNTSTASTNPSPRYPKRWYDDRQLEYPFE